jgi:predicted 2-oxoglutarate/Fe(II)-dependent dioxygenase YbiX
MSSSDSRMPVLEPPFLPGDPVPWFEAATGGSPRFSFAAIAGRFILLGFLGPLDRAEASGALAFLEREHARFDDRKLTCFGVILGGTDDPRIGDQPPGRRFFRDPDGRIAAAYGALEERPDGGRAYRPHWLLLDPQLRVLATIPFDDAGKHLELLASVLDRLPDVAAHAGAPLLAPVLLLPRVFEPGLCRALIQYYEREGGAESGFMRDIDGQTRLVLDHRHKRRADCEIRDEKLKEATRARIVRRVVPEILRAFQFEATRMDRYIVACYDAESGGHFRAHRDNTTKATAHRRFAVSINLDSAAYEGGDLSFPEFGPRRYRPPTGGAVVFSCSLLHEVSPVTKGRRYAFLPFLYDEAAAKIREANARLLAPADAPPAA